MEFVEHVLLESSVTLYNFEVDGNHNYYVADRAKADFSEFVLVHNKGCDKGFWNKSEHIGDVKEYKNVWVDYNGKNIHLQWKGYNKHDITWNNASKLFNNLNKNHILNKTDKILEAAKKLFNMYN